MRNNLAQPILPRDKEGEVPARAGAGASGRQVAQERKPKPGLPSLEQKGSQGLQRALTDCSSRPVSWEVVTPIKTSFLGQAYPPPEHSHGLLLFMGFTWGAGNVLKLDDGDDHTIM